MYATKCRGRRQHGRCRLNKLSQYACAGQMSLLFFSPVYFRSVGAAQVCERHLAPRILELSVRRRNLRVFRQANPLEFKLQEASINRETADKVTRTSISYVRVLAGFLLIVSTRNDKKKLRWKHTSQHTNSSMAQARSQVVVRQMCKGGRSP